MKNILRYSLVVVLATAITISSVSADHMTDCGCSPPEPVYCSECGCDGYAASYGSCCSDHAHVVSVAPGCCGEEVMHEAQPAQSEPDVTESLAPPTRSDPEPSVTPKTESPVTEETPAGQLAVPERDDLNDLFEAPPVTNTSITEPESVTDMPAVEETPVQPELDPLDNLFNPPATDPSPTEEMEENDAEPAEEKDPLDDFFSEVHRPAALSVPGGLESDTHRTWIDNTAKYQCEARLLGVAQGKIVLALADGKISHVPLRRLSDRDLSFVYQQVVTKRELLARQAETKMLASVWSE